MGLISRVSSRTYRCKMTADEENDQQKSNNETPNLTETSFQNEQVSTNTELGNTKPRISNTTEKTEISFSTPQKTSSPIRHNSKTGYNRLPSIKQWPLSRHFSAESYSFSEFTGKVKNGQLFGKGSFDDGGDLGVWRNRFLLYL